LANEVSNGDDAIPSGAELDRRLRELAARAAMIEEPGFSFGEWVPSWTANDGVIHLGWYRLSPQGEAFLAAARESGCVVPFNWPAWAKAPEVERLGRDPAAVAAAAGADLIRLLTALVRADRFSEGTLAEAFESGVLAAIVRRARHLTSQAN
jgi:hypothetical protein